jgi:hypothetical protein
MIDRTYSHLTDRGNLVTWLATMCANLRFTLAGALLTLLSSIAVAADPERIDSMAAIADDFVRVGLLFQNHDPSPYLYFGPETLRTDAKRQQTALADVVTQLVALRARIGALPAAAAPDEQRRRRDLAQRITATVTRGGILMGSFPASFDEEARLIFDVQVPRNDEAHFRAVTAKLDSIIPGDGELVTRIEAFRQQFVIPPERLEGVMERAIAECRARTLAQLELPSDEQVTLNMTGGKHWVGFAEYRGKSQSTYHLNRDVPVHIERAIELGCHEAYPGHHVHATLLDQELVGRRGWSEYSLLTLLGPIAVVAEGAANFGVDLAFSRQQRIDFDRAVLMPLAGLDGRQLETYYHYIDLLDELNFARNEVARKYLYEGLPRDQAVQWLMEFGLETRATASQRLDFIDTQRAYVITYNYGKRLVRDFVLGKGQPGSRAAWQAFQEVLTTPLAPADLLAATATSAPPAEAARLD